MLSTKSFVTLMELKGKKLLTREPENSLTDKQKGPSDERESFSGIHSGKVLQSVAG